MGECENVEMWKCGSVERMGIGYWVLGIASPAVALAKEGY